MRISRARQDLKRQTGMSDEQIEGFAVMLERHKSLQNRFNKKYSDLGAISGTQRALQQTRWQQNSPKDTSADESEGQDGEQAEDQKRMGAIPMRGARQGGRGRGGNTAGSVNDLATQAARRRKEQGRGRGSGRSRREGRARKMDRGMAGPTGQ